MYLFPYMHHTVLHIYYIASMRRLPLYQVLRLDGLLFDHFVTPDSSRLGVSPVDYTPNPNSQQQLLRRRNLLYQTSDSSSSGHPSIEDAVDKYNYSTPASSSSESSRSKQKGALKSTRDQDHFKVDDLIESLLVVGPRGLSPEQRMRRWARLAAAASAADDSNNAGAGGGDNHNNVTHTSYALQQRDLQEHEEKDYQRQGRGRRSLFATVYNKQTGKVSGGAGAFAGARGGGGGGGAGGGGGGNWAKKKGNGGGGGGGGGIDEGVFGDLILGDGNGGSFSGRSGLVSASLWQYNYCTGHVIGNS